MADTFSYKITTEVRPLTFDFAQVIGSGETISTAATSIIVRDGTDANPSAMLSGAPTISGTKVTQKVTGGISEVTYRLIVTITTSASNTYVSIGDLPVYSVSVVT